MSEQEASAVNEAPAAAPKAKRVISPEHRAKLVANAKKAGEARAAKILLRKAQAQPESTE